MQTHCPHCDTHFRVTDTQIDIADGLVRCGVCKTVFNVYEVDDSSETPAVITALTPAETPIEINEELPAWHQESSTAEDIEFKDNDDHSLDITAKKVPEEYLKQYSEQDSEKYPEQYTAEVTDETTESFSSLETLADDEPDNLDERITAEDASDSTDTFNFFDDNDNNSPGHVVPEEFRDSYESDTPSIISTMLWGFGVLLLTVALFVEYAWFNRNQFTHIPEVQAEIEELCQQFDCEKLSLRAPEKIELVARNIYSHPNEQDVLMVNVTMRNNASFSQPYPIMKIDFSNIRGGHIASRNFLPSEYLTIKDENSSEQPDLLAPDASSSITMEIVDPGKQALTYEFNFL